MEQGLPAETADMFYWCGGDLRIGGYKAMVLDLDVPAWSLDALLKVIPCPYQMTRGRDGSVQFMLLTVLRHDTFDSELEAVYTMVVWLLENDLLDEAKLRNYIPNNQNNGNYGTQH